VTGDERPPLSIDAHGGDWLKPPVRLGDDGAIYIRDPAGLADLDPGERARLVARNFA